MPSLQSVRRKIDSVKKTQKITKAMKMVAAAKLKRTQDRILAARPYALKMRDTIRSLSRRVNRDAHPLLKKREERRIVEVFGTVQLLRWVELGIVGLEVAQIVVVEALIRC